MHELDDERAYARIYVAMSQENSSIPLSGTGQTGKAASAQSSHPHIPELKRLKRRQAIFLFALAVIFLIVWQAPPQHAFAGVSHYAWLHTTLETFAIVVCGMVFGVAWNAYSRERPGNTILLATGLLATGIIHVFHMLSFAGMPEFVTPADPEKAINFWLAARYLFAALLLYVAFRPWKPLSRPSVRYMQLGSGLAVALLVGWVGLFHRDLLPRTFIPGQGLTEIKVGAEYILVALFAIAAIAFFRIPRQDPAYNIPSLFSAAAVSILGELCFTLYADVTDVFNLLGHVYTVVSFGFIYHAVFISSVREPFERLVRAEAKTRAASAYVHGLIEASLDPLVTVGMGGKVTGANHAMEEVTGIPRARLIGSDFSTYFVEPEKAHAIFKAVLEHGLARDYALAIRHTDGRATHVLCNGSVHFDEAGRIAGIFVAARDVTETKKAERALEQAHALLSNITATSPIGITVWDLDGHMKFVNAEAQQILKCSKEELMRLPYNPASWRITDLHGKALSDDDLPFHRVLASKHPVYDCELAIEGRDGKRILLSVNASPLRDASGRLEGVVATLDDITQRKAAEEKLLTSEERLAQAMSAAHMGAWTWDVTRDKVKYSGDFIALLGLPKEQSEANRATFFQLVHPQDQTMLADKIDRALHGDEDYSAEFRVIWPDKSIHWIGVNGSVSFDSSGKPLKMSGVGRDITGLKEDQLALERADRALRTLSAVNDKLIHARDETSLLNAVCRVIVEIGGYPMAWVGKALHDASKTVQPVAHFGRDEGFLALSRIFWSDSENGRGPTGTAIRTGVTQVNHNFATNPLMKPWREEALKRGYQSSISFPLGDSFCVHGSLTIYASEPDAFSPDEVRLLQEMADDLAFGITTLRTRADRDRMAKVQQEYDAILRQSLMESIQAIATTLELRDPYTAGHQRRVALLASAIGREMGLPESTIEGMHLAASIHDVGKIQVPSEILNKPGKISPIELELIKTHPQAGHDIVKDVRFPWPIARIILEHHERLDGSGYPNHLKGDEILLESRIVTVADVVEAMTSHRPYRPGLGLEAALEQIETNRGSWYDPQAVDACIRLFREKRYSFDGTDKH